MKILAIGNSFKTGYYRLGQMKSEKNQSSQYSLASSTELRSPSFNAREVLNRKDFIERFARLGIKDFDTEVYKKVVNSFRISDGFSAERLKLFETTAEFLKEKNVDSESIMKSLLTEIVPNCESMINSVNNLLNDGVPSQHVASWINFAKAGDGSIKQVDHNKINELRAVRSVFMSNKDKLKVAEGENVEEMIDALFFVLPKEVLNAFNILGVGALEYSFKDGYDSVFNYIVSLADCAPEVNEYLIEKTNPKTTPQYRSLEYEIRNNKNLFAHAVDDSVLEGLKKDIATATRIKNDMIKNSIKDPKDILEVSLIVSALRSDTKSAYEVLESFSNVDRTTYMNVLNEVLYSSLGLQQPDDLILKKLDFCNNKFLPRLFYSSKEFKEEFKSLVDLISKYPKDDNLTIFNRLKQNIDTKEAFKLRGLDYDAYTNYDPESKIELKNSIGQVFCFQKIDMNNIPKVLSLGEDADCCIKPGKKHDYATPSYARNKLISGIEVLHDGKAVGNTMCYLAEVEGDLALILDNVQLKRAYQFDETIKAGIINYAKKMCEEIGQPQMPIYANESLHHISITPSEKESIYTNISYGENNNRIISSQRFLSSVKDLEYKIIGYTGGDKVYLDKEKSAVMLSSPEKTFTAKLIRLD